MTIYDDTLCTCGHWFEEHIDGCAGCDAAGFDLDRIDHAFEYDADENDEGGGMIEQPNRFQRDIDHWNETGKCLRHFALDDPPVFCEQCGKRWTYVMDGREGRKQRRERAV